MERIAIFPGSFDPFTRGHQALVAEALRLFDRVVVAVGSNPAKRGLLTVENRKRLIDDIYAAEPRVEARIYAGLTGDFAREAGGCAIVRGVRNTADFEYERSLEAANRRLFPDIPTLLLLTPPEVADIASSAVREVWSFGHPVEAFLPEGVRMENYL